MKTSLTLQEKLRDLREERKLKLSDLSEATGIPSSTLQRLESDEDARIGYQDILVLTRFYDISADYLFGLTDNRQYRDAALDELHLSDKAIAELRGGNLDNRMLSELIAHPDFMEFLVAMEVYVDRTATEGIGLLHKAYKAAVDGENAFIEREGRDEDLAMMDVVGNSPDDYICYLLTRRFEGIARGIFEEHKKAAQSKTEDGVAKPIGEQLRVFKQEANKTGSAVRGVTAMFANQLGIDYNSLPESEKAVVAKFFSRAKFDKTSKKHGNRRKFGR